MKKIAIISNHPAPYRDPFLEGVVVNRGLDVDIYDLFPMDRGHSFWGLSRPSYKSTIIVKHPCSKLKTCMYMLSKFVFGRYDLVVWPGFLLWYLSLGMFVSALLGRQYGFMADSIKQGSMSRVAFWVKRYIVRHAAVLLVPGLASKEFFESEFGVKASRICIGGYALDNAALCARINGRREFKEDIRRKYGLSRENRVFLMVANMIKTRYYPITTAGFLDILESYPDARFVIVGRGPELAAMQALASRRPQLIVVPGVSFDDMLDLYSVSDVYVHGGEEPASTALVIGAIAGLPLLSSNAVGCARDCLEHLISGFRIEDHKSRKEWRDGFTYMMSNEQHWRDWGNKARLNADSLDVKCAIERFLEVVL